MNQAGGNNKVRLRKMKLKNNQPVLRTNNNNVGGQRKKFSVQQRLQKFKNKNFVKDAVIAENLQHLQQAAKKKRYAQYAYYNRQRPGQSPLTRNIQRRPPVHQRLGGVTDNLINNTNLPNLRRPMQNNAQNKFIKMQTVQQRLQRRNNQPRNQFNAQQLNLKPFTVVNNQVKGQRIKLRRNMQQRFNQNQQQQHNVQQQPVPSDYTIRVANDPNCTQLQKHSVLGSLNVGLQNQIKVIQAQSNIQQDIPPFPIHLSGVGVTRTTLHNRFSML